MLASSWVLTFFLLLVVFLRRCWCYNIQLRRRLPQKRIVLHASRIFNVWHNKSSNVMSLILVFHWGKFVIWRRFGEVGPGIWEEAGLQCTMRLWWLRAIHLRLAFRAATGSSRSNQSGNSIVIRRPALLYLVYLNFSPWVWDILKKHLLLGFSRSVCDSYKTETFMLFVLCLRYTGYWFRKKLFFGYLKPEATTDFMFVLATSTIMTAATGVRVE